MNISVIVPCYNSAATILATVDSILQQVQQPSEVIVIDDGSSDNPRRALGRVSDRIRFVEKPNGGVSSARNYGASLATGEWLGFCDADDVWLPEKLSVMRQAQDALPGISLFFHDFYVFCEKEVLQTGGTHGKGSIFPRFRRSGVQVRDLLLESATIEKTGSKDNISVSFGNGFRPLLFGNFILPSSCVINREAYHRVGGFNESFASAEETEFFLRVSQMYEIAYVDAVLCGYRLSGNSLTKDLSSLMENRIRALQEVLARCDREPSGETKTVRAALAGAYTDFGYYHLSELRKSPSRSYAWKSILMIPAQGRAWMILIASFFPRGVLRLVRLVKTQAKLILGST